MTRTERMHRAYVLTRMRQTARELQVDVQLAREAGATSWELAHALRISTEQLEQLEEAVAGV